ncbi:uncharacterized protein LOC115887596 [Sitophilus oryzae]|uniref:Uncharacterized protein LOC115874428 n=1 Tax=Sitophilus oryzae TaxID=7048 RepID=A0A6J2X390_SITOR|nr:uncharacterized protein LOC115874428 [Sitophilus oryzae]XP_030749246.1 uncharacterized protein LOC115877227 [Sitophilus oryzae]XP_030750610.1 uncharacterized protein LOC115878294 [Sitophilus oryzae]XP_030753969.1 uncharacterized protein LOC115880811 [Sitophilus oryzae]XP_030762740.1 uncharacterized protein LOC115887450 [Sitophilus oryzae]XP_030762925.1 uncharacterized protein LOC115887596 [Sitophilus oryzae]
MVVSFPCYSWDHYMDQESKKPNDEDGSNRPDPSPKEEETKERGTIPTPNNSPQPDQETEGPRSPSPEKAEGEPPFGVSKQLEKLSLEKKRFAGATRKLLSRLLKGGMPYETALQTILQRQAEKQRAQISGGTSSGKRQINPEENKPHTGAPNASKRIRSDASTPEQSAKKPCREGARSYVEAAGEIRVGVIRPNHPENSLSTEQLLLLKRAIMKAVDASTEEGLQVRFQGCSIRPGWLLVICADETSAAWLERMVNDLSPWQGMELRAVRGRDIPKPHVCTAYIPDDEPGERLRGDVVLNRLRRMNLSLLTQEWRILHQSDAGPGQTWTFAVDERSMDLLRRNGFRAYFGFGQITFRPRDKENETNTEQTRASVSGDGGDHPTASRVTTDATRSGNTQRERAGGKVVARKNPAMKGSKAKPSGASGKPGNSSGNKPTRKGRRNECRFPTKRGRRPPDGGSKT